MAMKPLRAPTHRSLSFDQIARLAASLDDIAEDGAIELEAILDLASELGVGAEKLMAALPTTDNRLVTDQPIRFEVCVGGCQDWGALPLVERLLDVREQRQDDGGTLFDIVPRSCLDKCQSAACVALDTGDGRAFLAAATVATIDEALASI